MSNTTQLLLRILFSIGCFVFIFVLPWWLSIILITAGIFVFPKYFEALVFAILLDGYVGVPSVAFGGTNMFFVSVIGVIFVAALFLKLRLTFYSN